MGNPLGTHMGNGSGRGLQFRTHYPRGLGNGSCSPTHSRVMAMSTQKDQCQLQTTKSMPMGQIPHSDMASNNK